MKKFMYGLLTEAKKEKDLKMIESIYNGNKYDSIIKFEYAKMLNYYGKYNEGNALLLELLESRNADYAMLELGKAEQAVGNISKARDYYNTLIKKGDSAAIYKLAKLEINQNNPEEARKLLMSIINFDKSGLARIELGKLESNLGNNNKARGHFKTALNINKTPIAKIALGRLERNLGNFEEAKRFFKSVYEDDMFLSGKFELGRLAFTLGEIEDAKRIFKEIQKDHDNLQAYLELGKVEASLGNYEEAKDYFLKCIDTPIERFAYHILIVLYIKQQKYEEAFIYTKEAIDKKIWINSDLLIDIGKHLNVFFDLDYTTFPSLYSVDQLADYDPYLAIDHIDYRHVGCDSSSFSSNIDVYKLFNDIQKDLTEANKTRRLSYSDVYIIPYPNAGTYGQNHIKVITIPNTKDIITMYPIFSMYDYIDDEETFDEESNISLTKKRNLV